MTVHLNVLSIFKMFVRVYNSHRICNLEILKEDDGRSWKNKNKMKKCLLKKWLKITWSVAIFRLIKMSIGDSHAYDFCRLKQYQPFAFVIIFVLMEWHVCWFFEIQVFNEMSSNPSRVRQKHPWESYESIALLSSGLNSKIFF